MSDDQYSTGQLPERDEVTGELIAWDREESDPCERGTPGCSIHHSRDSECQTWLPTVTLCYQAPLDPQDGPGGRSYVWT